MPSALCTSVLYSVRRGDSSSNKMTIMKYVVAVFIVMLAQSRLSDEAFIMQSFLTNDGNINGRVAEATKQSNNPNDNKTRSIKVVVPTKDKRDTRMYVEGKFCTFCPFNEGTSCT